MGTTSVFRTVDSLGRILTRVKDPKPPERDMVSFTRLNVSAEICGRDEKKIDNRENLKRTRQHADLLHSTDLQLPSTHGMRTTKSIL